MNENIKYVILDFGKVLAGPKTGFWFITPNFEKYIDINTLNRERFNNSIKKYNYILDRKATTKEEEYLMFLEFYQAILNDNGIKNKNVIEMIAKDFVYNRNKYIFYDHLNEELTLLAKKYKLILLSDNWPCVIDIMRDNNLDKYFIKMYISSFYGCKKEDGYFFDYPIHDFNISSGEAIFIDDNESLLDIAYKKGISVLLMDRDKKIHKSKYKIIHDLNNII